MINADICRGIIVEHVNAHLSIFGFKQTGRSNFTKRLKDITFTYRIDFKLRRNEERLLCLKVDPCIAIRSKKVQRIEAELTQKQWVEDFPVIAGNIGIFTSERNYKTYFVPGEHSAISVSPLLVNDINSAFLPLVSKITSLESLFEFLAEETNKSMFDHTHYIWLCCSIFVLNKQFDQAKTFLLRNREKLDSETIDKAIESIDRLAAQINPQSKPIRLLPP